MSVRENLTLALLPRLARSASSTRRKQREIVERFIKRLGIKCAGPEQKIRELSGGNQQKVLLARWLCMNPKLLILDEPTRGIDVGAKAEIQALIRELADQGLGVLMISSELEEIDRGLPTACSCCATGARWPSCRSAELTEPAVMTAMAHGDGGGRCVGVLRPVGRSRCPSTALPASALRRARRARAAASLFNFACHAELRHLADAQRQSHPGLHHRHRRRSA